MSKKKLKVKTTSLSKTNKKKQKKEIVQLTGIDQLIQTALKEKTGIDQLKELMKMKYEYDDRKAEKIFYEKFKIMQDELPIIKKTRIVKNKHGKELYRYASLDDIVQPSKGVIHSHGFSYRWSEEFPNDKTKRIRIHVTGYGHTATAFIDLPILSKTDLINDIQQSGTTSTYGKRYTFIGMFGIMAEVDYDGEAPATKKDPGTKKDPELKPKTKKWKKEENDIFKKIVDACKILNKNGHELLTEIQKEKPEVEDWEDLKLKDLKDIHEVLSGQVDKLAVKE